MKKLDKSGFATLFIVAIVLIAAVGGVLVMVLNNKNTNDKIVDTPVAIKKKDAAKKPQDVMAVTDKDFVMATTDAQAKVLARGDINNDSLDDAVVRVVACGASCSVLLEVVFAHKDSKPTMLKSSDNYAQFGPAYKGDTAVKSSITSVSIDKGIISLTGQGLDCGGGSGAATCPEQEWAKVKTATYKFDGTKIVQLAVK